MTNIYWPVYLNLESELNQLMFNIHIDDQQVNVYSPKIADLVVRCCIEIESIVKALVTKDLGPLKSYFKFDEDGIIALNDLYFLEEKEILVSSVNCFQSERILKPFIKSEMRTRGKTLTYPWNNAYQNIKHDRASSLKYGSIKNLFGGMATLYTLNILFKNETQYIGKQSEESRHFDFSQGSSIFSIKLSKDYSSQIGIRIPNLNNTDKTALFRTIPTQATWERNTSAMQEYNEIFNRLRSEIFQRKVNEGEIDIKGFKNNELIDLINAMKVPEHIYQIAAQNVPNFLERVSKLNFEAIIIKKNYQSH